MLNQKDGVYSVIKQVIGDFNDGDKVELTSEQRSEVIELVSTGLMEGGIQMAADSRLKYDDMDKMRTYTSGLVSNWLRKDPRLNGGIKYEAKNPGSRAGSGDKVVRELKKLQRTFTKESSEWQAIQEELDKRVAHIQAQKAKSIEIDADLIPAELKHLVNQ